MRQPITMWPLKQQVSQGCVRVCKVCACGACRWWGEGWGDARCQVSGLIMALPAQSGRLVGWELYKPQKGGQEATKLHTRANPAFAHTHTPQVACSRHGSEAKERVWTRGLSCDTQSDNKSKAATQAGGGEAPAQCQCRGGGGCGGYSKPGHQYPSAHTSSPFLFYSTREPFAPLFLPDPRPQIQQTDCKNNHKKAGKLLIYQSR